MGKYEALAQYIGWGMTAEEAEDFWEYNRVLSEDIMDAKTEDYFNYGSMPPSDPDQHMDYGVGLPGPKPVDNCGNCTFGAFVTATTVKCRRFPPLLWGAARAEMDYTEWCGEHRRMEN